MLLLSKVYIVWGKKVQRSYIHDTEEWYKIWKGINLWFENWHKEFNNFDLSTRKSQKCSLRCAPFEQVIFSELEKYRRAIFHGTEDWCKIWRKTELQFGKWHEEFDKFSPEHLKVSKLGLWWHPFVQSIKCVSLKFTEEFCVSWKWRMMQSLKRNWLIISKLKGIEECWP